MQTKPLTRPVCLLKVGCRPNATCDTADSGGYGGFMGSIYAAADGTLIRALFTPDEERQYPDPPPGTAQTIKFHTDTNAALIAGIDRDWNAHRVVGGVLQRNGQAVTINGPSEETVLRETERATLDALLARIQQGGNLTAQEIRQALQITLRDARRNR